MITPASRLRPRGGEQNPAYVLLSHPSPTAAMGQASHVSRISATRLEQLVALLRTLGLDPHAAGGPGSQALVLAPLEEALTHSSAGRAINHEQLEFLGDAVLRLAATEFLERRQPSLAVGRRSSLRAQLVSDRWLAEQAEALDLAAMLHLGPMALGDGNGRGTVLAECCEALVGAIYRVWGGSQGGLEAVLRWLSPAWEATSAELLADPDRHNWKSALQEWTQGQGLGLPHYQCREISRRHGDPRRFHAQVCWAPEQQDESRLQAACEGSPQSPGDDSVPVGESLAKAEGWGGSRREAEQQAASAALNLIRRSPESPGAR
jgi:ribonuclease-3